MPDTTIAATPTVKQEHLIREEFGQLHIGPAGKGNQPSLHFGHDGPICRQPTEYRTVHESCFPISWRDRRPLCRNCVGQWLQYHFGDENPRV